VKRSAIVFVLLLLGITGLAGTPAQVRADTGGASGRLSASSPRQKVNFNRGWKFARSNVTGAQDPGFDDSAWVPVALPHDFDAPYDVGGGSGGGSFYVGVGWYRKHFTAPSSWSGRHVELEFEGAFSVTDVWVNGTKVGTHRGG
jgi:beta-galactosidase